MKLPVKLIAPLFAFTLVAAACGSDGDDDTAADDTTTSEAVEAEETTTTVEETTTTEAEETTTTAADGDAEGAGSDYCNVTAEAERLVDEWQIGSPESTEEYFTEIIALIDSIDPPSEVADDFELLRENFVELSAELEAVGWNILAIDENDPVLVQPEVEAATDRIEAFDAVYCGDSGEEAGVVSGLDGDDLASLLDNPEFQEFMTESGISLTDEQTACLAENLDAELLESAAGLLGQDPTSLDPEVVGVFLGILTTCEIPLTALTG